MSLSLQEIHTPPTDDNLQLAYGKREVPHENLNHKIDAEPMYESPSTNDNLAYGKREVPQSPSTDDNLAYGEREVPHEYYEIDSELTTTHHYHCEKLHHLQQTTTC